MADPTKKLAELLYTAKDLKELRAFIEDLFTKEEVATILQRWEAISLLLEGRTHRSVQDAVGISISKVTHAANLLKAGGQGVRQLYLRTAKKS